MQVVWFYVNAYIVFDIMQGTLMGTIKGLGAQAKASVVVLIGYYFIGIPLGALSAFGEYHLLLEGVWIGFSSAIGFNMFVYLVLLYCWIDWRVMARLAHERSEKNMAKAEPKVAESDENFKKEIN